MTTTDSEQPYFDFELQRIVNVSVGQTAFLHCRVERLGDKDVSKILFITNTQMLLLIKMWTRYTQGYI